MPDFNPGAVAESPYVGLRPFREADNPFFFGRERDIRIIVSNLTNSSLTVLYGSSGVGKSSVLQAGVVPQIRKASGARILYFNEWQDASFLARLRHKCADLVVGEGSSAIDEMFRRTAGPFFLLLDQFEEYLLYHGGTAVQEEFEAMLARMINRDDGTTNILIGIREDALFRLDERLSLRVPNLLENTLPLKHLTAATAREAIEQPIRVLNESLHLDGDGFRIDSALVDALLDQMKPQAIDDMRAGPQPDARSEDSVETAFLQLVLSRIWTETVKQRARILSLHTLADMGGAQTIVQTHVRRVLDGLSDTQREIAARLFGHLVTPSRGKIAQTMSDLVAFGEASSTDVGTALRALTDTPDSRILRRLSNPERYELFHDVLAQPILDWRRDHLDQAKRIEERRAQETEAARQRKELEQAQAFARVQGEIADVQTASARKLRVLVMALSVLILLAVSTAIFALAERRKADRFADAAEAEKQQADAARKQAESARNQATIAERLAQARASEAEAARLEARGEKTKAQELESAAKAFRREATDLTSQTAAEREKSMSAASSVTSLRADLAATNRELEAEKKRRSSAEDQVRDLNAKLDAVAGTVAALKTKADKVPDLAVIQQQLTLATELGTSYAGTSSMPLTTKIEKNDSKTRLLIKNAVLHFSDGRELSSLKVSSVNPALESFLRRRAIRSFGGTEETLLYKDDSYTIRFEPKDVGDPRNVDLVVVTLEVVNTGEQFEVRTKPAIVLPPPPPRKR